MSMPYRQTGIFGPSQFARPCQFTLDFVQSISYTYEVLLLQQGGVVE